MRRSFECAAVVAACITVAQPASAARYLITVQGTATAFVQPGGTPIAAVASLAGQSVLAAFQVDTSNAAYFDTGPIGGQGAGAFWTGSVQLGAINVGSVSLLSNANDAGAIFLIDNGGIPNNPNARQDQATITSGARIVSGALLESYDVFGFADPDIYVHTVTFGRVRPGDVNNLPGLVTNPALRPDFPSYLFSPGGSPPFLSFQFRLGNPTSAAQAAALPQHGISVASPIIDVQLLPPLGVPEPSSWALLIIGFGLTGAALRRRRAVAA